MNETKIEITVSYFAGKFFTNASLVTGEPLQDFVCTTGQPTLDMSLASAMSFIRDYAVKLQKFSLAEPAGPEDQKKCYVCGGSGLVIGTKPDGSEDLINLDPCFYCTPEGRARLEDLHLAEAKNTFQPSSPEDEDDDTVYNPG